MQGFVHVDLDARRGADARTGEGGRAGADAGNLEVAARQGAGVGAGNLLAGRGGDIGICHKAFKAADGHRLALGPENALALALVFLRADAAADGGQAVGAFDNAVGGVHIANRHFADKVADGHFHRAAADAEGFFTL